MAIVNYAAKCGSAGKLTIGTHDVAELSSFTLDQANSTIPTPSYQDTGLTVICCGPYTWSGTAAGYWAMDDGPGQAALQDALQGGTTVSLKAYIDATDYYSGSIYITGVSVASSAEPGNVVTVSFNYEGTGALSMTLA